MVDVIAIFATVGVIANSDGRLRFLNGGFNYQRAASVFLARHVFFFLRKNDEFRRVTAFSDRFVLAR